MTVTPDNLGFITVEYQGHVAMCATLDQAINQLIEHGAFDHT